MLGRSVAVPRSFVAVTRAHRLLWTGLASLLAHTGIFYARLPKAAQPLGSNAASLVASPSDSALVDVDVEPTPRAETRSEAAAPPATTAPAPDPSPDESYQALQQLRADAPTELVERLAMLPPLERREYWQRFYREHPEQQQVDRLALQRQSRERLRAAWSREHPDGVITGEPARNTLTLAIAPGYRPAIRALIQSGSRVVVSVRGGGAKPSRFSGNGEHAITFAPSDAARVVEISVRGSTTQGERFDLGVDQVQVVGFSDRANDDADEPELTIEAIDDWNRGP